jgi:hypothetical protein
MYARVGLKGGGIMKHQKEWRTCDRCGKEIIPKNWKEVRFKQVGCCGDIVPTFEDNDMCLEIKNVRRYKFLEKTYELCPKCRKDFERFMRNENIDCR